MTVEELAKAHAKNRAKLNRGLIHHKAQMNESIKAEDEFRSSVNIRFYIILQVSWVESSLQYILHYYYKQVNPSARFAILSEKSQLDMWSALINLKFREHYMNRKRRVFNIKNMGHTGFTRYNYLTNLLNTEVASFIEIRNKLAHGQWAIALNGDGTDKVQETTSKLWTLTKKDTLMAHSILKKFVVITDSLVASKFAFESCFDEQVQKLENDLDHFKNKHQWIVDEMKRRFNSVERTYRKKDNA